MLKTVELISVQLVSTVVEGVFYPFKNPPT
uniref:Uncharacterized protein n=1 Tax=Anguilla anguilla TaxID=7936 RepID=A0A0E9QQ06_ANGAN